MTDKKDSAIKRVDSVSTDVASSEFERWADVWNIDTDKTQMDEDDKQSFENLRHQFILAVTKRRLTVSEDAESVTVHLRTGEDLTFNVPQGSAWLTMDHHKSNREMRKIFAYAAEMCGKQVAYFSKMDGRDVKVCHTIVILFLG